MEIDHRSITGEVMSVGEGTTGAMTHRDSTRALIARLSDIIGKRDERRRERRRTAPVGIKVFGEKRGWFCAICGSRTKEIQAAHIYALEEGGRTDRGGCNLVLLCHGPAFLKELSRVFLDSTGKVRSGDDGWEKTTMLGAALDTFASGSDRLGCHELFDHGLMSQEAVRGVRQQKDRWGSHGEMRRSALDIPLSSLDPEYTPGSNRSLKMLQLRQRLADFAPEAYADHADAKRSVWVKTLGDSISVHRRTFNPDDFQIAETMARQAELLLGNYGDAPLATHKDVLLYEMALLEMAKASATQWRRIGHLFRTSCRAALAAKKEQGWAMSTLERVHAITFRAPRLTAARFRILRRVQDQCVDILVARPGQQPHHSIRWRMNALMHSAQLCLKAGRIDEAEMRSREAWTLRAALNVTTGWRQFQAVHMLTIDAVIAAHRSNHGEALRLVARAVKVLKAARGKRPEGFKDLAECAAWALNRLGESEAASRAKAIASAMIDGRSGFWMVPALAESTGTRVKT